MILLELFDKTPDYEVTRETSGQFKTEAVINGRKIVFRAELDRGDVGEFWDISFEEVTDRATYKATGSGKAFDVLAMVTASLTEFRDRYHPEIVFFSADSGTRASIYRRIVDSVLSGYSHEEIKTGSERLFWYRKTG